MNIYVVSILATLLLLCTQCSADVNQQLQSNSLTRIPIPTQSLLPPTFENPIKDYTVGLIPPPIDAPAVKDDTRPKVQTRNQKHFNSYYARPSGPVNSARPSVNSVPQRYAHYAVNQKTHHSSNILQPQVYQPKTAIRQTSQHFTAHHHHSHPHPHPPSPSTSTTSVVRQPVAAVTHNHQHKYSVPAPQYYQPIIQRRVYQHSSHTNYVPTSVQGPPLDVHLTYPSIQAPAFVSTPLTPYGYGGSIIQTYPSVGYEAIPYGSSLDFGNAKLDPELVKIINDVYGKNH